MFGLIIQRGIFCWFRIQPCLFFFFSSPSLFVLLDICHLVFWHITYHLFSELFWISLRSRHLPNPPIPRCQAQSPTVDPAIEANAHEIISARPTHSRKKGRPTFTPIPTRWPTFPKLHKIQDHSTPWFSCISKWLTRHSCQIESFKQTDEYMLHCLLLSLSSSLTLNQTAKHICTKNAQ